MEKQIMDFENWLIARSTANNFRNYDLYKLLDSYSNSRCRIEDLQQKLIISKTNCCCEEKVWSQKKTKRTFYGECGDKKHVYKDIEYEIAHFDSKEMDSVTEQLEDNQNNLKDLIWEVFRTEMIKSEIDYFVRKIISYPPFQNTELSQQNSRDDFIQCIQDLRLAVSIFFDYLRKPIQNQDFIKDVQTWLLKLTAVQSKLKTLEDHWFLLFHLLRCPNKLSWAIPMIQVPCSSQNDFQEFGSYLCLSMLSMILSPINKRREFLMEFQEAHRKNFESNSNSLWVFVESDGEESNAPLGDYTNLSENNLIELLNQIPFENLFRSLLVAEEGNNNITTEFTEKQLVKIIDFNSLMIKTLAVGLNNYNSEKYRHFNKRLGLIIKHCIHYTYDYCSRFINKNLAKDRLLIEKVKIKFDDFLVLACACLHNSRNTGVLQFIQFIPYCAISQTTLYAIFYQLNVGFSEHILPNQDYRILVSNTNFLDEFNVQIEDKTEEDVHFLLQIFFEMAIARNKISDWRFIQTVSKHIFFVGYINEKTSIFFYKTCKDILCNLTSVYPELISDLVILTHDHLPVMKYAEYVFNFLPINIWRPNISCLEILSMWLLKYSYEDKQNLLAREIFDRMNWDFTPENDLFLPRDVHIYTACVLSEAATKYSCESTSFAKNTFLPINEQFIDWCWKLLLRLHLHYLDQALPIPENMLQYCSNYLMNIPDVSEVEILVQGVTDNSQIAMYLSIHITLWGHSIPLICQKGFEMVYVLLIKRKVIIALRCLELITIFFTECPETLIKCIRFQKIISKLIEDEKTMNTLSHSSLELFRNMTQSQINRFKEYGFESPKSLILLWLKLLIYLPSNSQKYNKIYILDGILATTHCLPNLWMDAKNCIQSEYWKLRDSLGNVRNEKIFYKCLWYTMVVLNIEHDILELKSNMWFELIGQLENDENTSLNLAFKAAASHSASHYCMVNDLVIFKYADIIMKISHKHYFLPIIIKEFVKLCNSSQNPKKDKTATKTMFAAKLYNCNPAMMDGVLDQLKTAENYYKNQCQCFTDQKLDVSLEFCKKLWRFYKDVGNWLFEISVSRKFPHMKTNVIVPSYSKNLADMVHQDEVHWNGLLNYNQIAGKINEHMNSWLKSCARKRSAINSCLIGAIPKSIIDPKKRTLCYLKSYDVPQKPLNVHEYTIMQIKSENISEIFKKVTNLTSKLKKNSIILMSLSNELSTLNNSCQVLLMELYKQTFHEEIHRVKCSTGLVSTFYACSKPAEIMVKIVKSNVNLKIKKQIQVNRNTYGKVLNTILSEILQEAAGTIGKLKFLMKNMTESCNKSSLQLKEDINFLDFCKTIFFELVELCDENIDSFFPTISVMRNLIFSLGICIQKILHTEGYRVVKAALKYKIIANELCDIIEPLNTSFEIFIKMYETLIESEVNACNLNIALILISKFDLQCCLRNFQPNSNETDCLVGLVFRALNKWTGEKYLLIVYRRQLIDIFQFEFPLYYDEVMRFLLTSCRRKEIQPIVIKDIINSLLGKKFDEIITDDIYKDIKKFVTNQKSLNLTCILQTLALLAEQFHSERIQNGMHGIYSHYEEYCENLSVLFSYFGQLAISTAKNSISFGSTDEFSKKVLMPIFVMYNPWTCVYTVIQLGACKVDWTINNTENKNLFYPWSESQSKYAKMIMDSLASIIEYSSSSDKINKAIMANVFDWYVSNFTSRKLPSHIGKLICNVMIDLPWSCYYPLNSELERSHQILMEGAEENIIFLGNTFPQIPWMDWFFQVFTNWDIDTQDKSMNVLLAIIFKIYLHINFHASLSKSEVSTALLMLPWERISYNDLENVFHWMETSKPIFTLHLLSGQSKVDLFLLSLLKNSCAMSNVHAGKNTFKIRTKRLLFVRKIISLAKKVTSENETIFQENTNVLKTIILDLLQTIGNIVDKHNRTSSDSNKEAVNLLFEIINSSTGQNDHTSAIFMDSVITWQANQNVNKNMLIFFLEAIAMKNSFELNAFKMLESSIDQYFKHKDFVPSEHDNGWEFLMQKLGRSFDIMELSTVILGKNLLVAHLLLKYNMENEDEVSRKLFLSKMVQLLEIIKISEELEIKLAILWGGLICSIENSFPLIESREELTKLASYMNSIANNAESWSSRLLGIVGLHFSSVTPKFIILSRCLTTFIYFVCNKRNLYQKSLGELKCSTNVKSNSEMSLLAVECVKIIENNEKSLESIISPIFDIIQIIYNDPIVTSSKDLWVVCKNIDL